MYRIENKKLNKIKRRETSHKKQTHKSKKTVNWLIILYLTTPSKQIDKLWHSEKRSFEWSLLTNNKLFWKYWKCLTSTERERSSPGELKDSAASSGSVWPDRDAGSVWLIWMRSKEKKRRRKFRGVSIWRMTGALKSLETLF